MARPASTPDVFSALGHPRRRLILELLGQQDLTVAELTRELGIAQPSVSEQLSLLREVGLVDSTSQGRKRVYRINPAPLRTVADWLVHLDAFWDERFARLGRLLEDLDEEST
ncbi:ArsR/SmtB family transcription factor [Sediminivirga luteola]|uniref:Transcriptional regulator n=1 Tax=Sediminivirga luteola TaxID=1774748 RepID=A0A8J2TVX1_9MICO|nr:metalloregulator ArsR/SmtB family transcription factor [Sediminivirga luteola]MCI2264410.1 metalloregulator ArsR/SmtB family transcription factor [Sediminivirga luteola]GGA05987.1 transcriptional regulator [Sediminivirga luteola]